MTAQNSGRVTCRAALWWIPPLQCMTGAWSPGWSLLYTSPSALLGKISIGHLRAISDGTSELLKDAWRHSCRASLRPCVGSSALCLSSIRMKSTCFLRIPLQLWLDDSKLSKHLEGEDVRLKNAEKNHVRKRVYLHFALRDDGLWVSDIVQLLTNNSFFWNCMAFINCHHYLDFLCFYKCVGC